MPSLFFQLLAWNQLSPFLIRLALGAVLLHWSYRALKARGGSGRAKTVGALEGIVGILLVIGLWTQAAALVAAIDLLVRIGERISKKAFLTDGVNYYLILLILALSLLVTGPGFFARDLFL